MAGFAGDDPFDFDDYSDGAEFCYDPFDCDDGDEDEEFCVSGFSFPDGDDGEELCVSGFAFPDGDESLMVEDQASSHEEPILETLGRSFDSDEGLGMFLPQLVSALELEDSSGEEDAASGLDREPRQALEEAAVDDGDDGLGFMFEEAADDDGDDGLEFMLSGFDLDPRPVTGGFQLVDADEGWEEVAGDDDMGEWGGPELSGFDLGASPAVAVGAFRMLVEDIDSDDGDLLDALAAHVGEAAARSGRLPASRAAVEALPEVAPSEEEASSGCPVCKDGIEAGQLVVRLPCKHFFHGDCIRPWLAIRNTCPVCRYELPTGNAEYDRQRRTAGGASPAQQGPTAQIVPTCYHHTIDLLDPNERFQQNIWEATIRAEVQSQEPQWVQRLQLNARRKIDLTKVHVDGSRGSSDGF
ncbi:hypothetical protein EJB05_24644, partial [Eragrostis curvula]